MTATNAYHEGIQLVEVVAEAKDQKVAAEKTSL